MAAELHMQVSSLTKEVARLTKLLSVAQRDAAIHKQAAEDAAALAKQRLREARIQMEALRKGPAATAPSTCSPLAPVPRAPPHPAASLPGFAALRAAYEAQQRPQGNACTQDHHTARLRVALSSKPAVSRDPVVVAKHVGKLKRLAASHGVPLAMESCGPCRWRVGACTLTLHVADKRLMARTGGGYEDVMQALARLAI